MSKNEKHFVNIAFYKFVQLDDLTEFKQKLLNLCTDLQLKGTILLATEGINSCLVGEEIHIETFIYFLQSDKRFADIEFKKSVSDHIPFRRMLVKIKKEIIPMGMESIKPQISTGKYVSALELKSWYEAKEDLVVLDTRNDYEVELGTFRNSINPDLKEFRAFPDWIRNNFAQYKDKKVVTFCTGGIRCEKATAFMEQEGFTNVYQVQGGILKYLEETKIKTPGEDNFYDGDCFVFDNRVAVDKNLEQSKFILCYNCWKTLSNADLEHPQYKKDFYCPYCVEKYQKKKELSEKKMKSAIVARIERAKVARENYLKSLELSFS